MDVGLLNRATVGVIEEKGAYIGTVKGSHGAVHDLVADWVACAGVEQRPPDHVQIDKGHGRLERRELWVVSVGALGTYLQADFNWPAVQFVSQHRRYRRRLRQTDWESVTTTPWMAGGSHCLDLT